MSAERIRPMISAAAILPQHCAPLDAYQIVRLQGTYVRHGKQARNIYRMEWRSRKFI
jgi:hypothetical protein